MNQQTDERHRYGQHYTPFEVARLLAALAIEGAADTVFDPSCGDGRLLREAINVKRRLVSSRARRDAILARGAFGIDRSSSAVKQAAKTRARVVAADFFDVEPGAILSKSVTLPTKFDAIIGNPPYIRQEVMGARDKKRISERMKMCCALSPEIFWPRWSGRSDIYVYFFAHAARFLRPGGRLVFLTASSWLDAGYGEPLREFLLKNFRVLALIESSAESFFDDASINTVITALARETKLSSIAANRVRFVQLKKTLGEILQGSRAADSVSSTEEEQSRWQIDSAIGLARSIAQAAPTATDEASRIKIVNQAELFETGIDDDHRGAQRDNHARVARGWGKYLRADEVFFRILERGTSRLCRLSEFARVRFGVKTGANEFFYVKGSDDQETNGRKRKPKGDLLRLRDVAFVRRGLTTGANEFFYLQAVEKQNEPGCDSCVAVVEDGTGAHHLIESRYLSPIIFSLKEISGIELDGGQFKRLFFNCAAARAELAGTLALGYILSGERAGHHLRPTCAARDPWYAVARSIEPAPLIFPSKIGERWIVALNRARVFEDKKLYGIFPGKQVSRLVLAALLNSTWARYYAEVTCRQMTGAQAIADIDVVVAEQIMLPDPRKLQPSLKTELRAALKALARRRALSIFEEVEREDRRRLDLIALRAIGFSNRAEREAALDKLYEAVTRLVRERVSRSRNNK